MRRGTGARACEILASAASSRLRPRGGGKAQTPRVLHLLRTWFGSPSLEVGFIPRHHKLLVRVEKCHPGGTHPEPCFTQVLPSSQCCDPEAGALWPGQIGPAASLLCEPHPRVAQRPLGRELQGPPSCFQGSPQGLCTGTPVTSALVRTFFQTVLKAHCGMGLSIGDFSQSPRVHPQSSL